MHPENGQTLAGKLACNRVAKGPVLVKTQQVAGGVDKLAGLNNYGRDTDTGGGIPRSHI